MSDPAAQANSPAACRQSAVLALLCSAQLLLAIDGTIVTVALPTIARSLQLSNENLQWLVTIYALTFGGFLMIGGRSGDLFGRRKMFVAGILIFMVMSVLCGASRDQAMLIAGRAAQGFGAAVASPSALSFLTGSFPEGSARNRALGIWAATGGTGAVAGNVIGGSLIALSGWRLIFFVNVPICLVVVGLAFRYLPATPRGPRQSLDLPGALCVTGGLGSLIFSFGKIEEFGLTAASSVVTLILGFVLLVAFVFVERHARNPLLPLGILRRPVVVGNLLAIFASLLVSGCYFFASLYTQQVLGYSALRAGLCFAPWAAIIATCAIIASRNNRRFGGRRISTIGYLSYCAGALFFLSIMTTSTHYLSGLLPSFVLLGIGTGLCTVTNTIAAMSGVERRFQGVAAGLTNSSQRMGSSLGVAILATVATSHMNSLLRLHVSQRVAEVTGLRLALVVAAALAGLGAVISAVFSPRRASESGIAPERVLSSNDASEQDLDSSLATG